MTATELVSTTEQEDFARLDGVVRRGLATFVEIGEALREIRDRKLYRIRFKTFAKYLRHEHGLNKSRGYQLISAARVAVELQGVDSSSQPLTESHCRELIVFDNVTRKKVWHETAKTAESSGVPITARLIKEVGRPYRHPVDQPATARSDQFPTILDATRALADAIQKIESRWPPGSHKTLALQLYGIARDIEERTANNTIDTN